MGGLDPRAVRGAFAPVPRTVLPPDSVGDDPISGATAAQMARRRYGGPTRTESRTVTLTTTPTQIIGNNPRRVFWSIINRGIVNSAVDIDLAMTFANGILMGAAGGFVQSDVNEDGESVAWPVFGACESATCVVRILETMRV